MSYVLHLPSRNKIIYENLLKTNYDKIFNKPDNIAIIIPITLNQIDNSYLIKQLKMNGYDYYNSITKNIIWKPYEKPIHIYNSLKICKEEYSLILDGNDTIITDNLDNMINDLNSYKIKAVYNAEIYKSKKLPNFKHICCNGGIVFGETKYLLNFYKQVVEYINNLPTERKSKCNSEQPFINKAMRYFDDIGVDYNEILFKCFNYQFKGE